MSEEREIQDLVKNIRQALPGAADQTDRLMADSGFDQEEEAHYLWMEALAEVANELICQKDEGELKALLAHLSSEYDSGSGAVKNCIEVSFVENLLWDLEPDEKAWAWPRIPDNLAKLYTATQGKPAAG